MNEENEIIDQTELATDISNKIKYTFFDFYLVKPLEAIKVKKEFSKPVSTGTPAKDKNDIEAQDFDNVETEVIEVDSDFVKGVVLKCPTYRGDENILSNIKVGDIVIFRDMAGLKFDLLKDSRLLRVYDVLGIEG